MFLLHLYLFIFYLLCVTVPFIASKKRTGGQEDAMRQADSHKSE